MIIGSPVADFTKEVLPFLAASIGVLLLVTYMPSLVLFFPNLIMSWGSQPEGRKGGI